MSHRDSSAAARLTALYEAHAADAFRYALHLTGRREDAEDVVQFVFLQAYAALDGGRALVNPRAWLIKATKHRSLNLIRDRRDTPAAEIRATGALATDAGEAAALADVRASLWSLPEPQHHAFVLRHWSGLSQAEIADVLETTPGAVESLLVRARATLVAEHETPDSLCAGVRGRLVRMLAPTPAHEAHLQSCHRCRTAQARLLRASGFAAALVPGPQVAHALAAIVPGFGASGAAAGTAAAGAGAGGAGAGTGTGGAAVSTASLATKAGIAAKIAAAAATAAVAVTAVHPVRSAVSHAVFAAPAPRSATSSPHASAHAHATQATPGATSASAGGGRHGSGAASGATGAPGNGPARGNGNGKGQATTGSSGGSGSGKGKSGTAGSNGNGNGQGGGTAAGAGAANGKSASAPGQTKAAGSNAAGGNGKGSGNKGGTSSTAGPNGNAGSHGTSGSGGNGKGNGKS